MRFKMDSIKEMPNDQELEKKILGMALIADGLGDTQALSLINGLDVKDFHCETYQAIIAAIKKLIKENKPITIPVLKTEFPDADWLLDISIMAEDEITTADMNIHIAKLKEYSRRREILRVLTILKNKAHDQDIASSELLRILNSELSTLALDQVQSLEPAINNLAGFYESLGAKNTMLGLETGFNELDRLTLGFRKLILLAGEPKIGKTSFILQIAGKIAQGNIPVIFYSFELSQFDLIARLLSRLSGINVNKLKLKARPYLSRDKKDLQYEECLDKEESENLYKATAPLEHILNNLYIRDQLQGINFDLLEYDIKQIQQKRGIQNILVVIDHLQIFPLEAKAYVDTLDKENTKISRFNDIQKRTGAAIVLISQFNKSAIEQLNKSGTVSMAGVKGSVDNIYLSHFIITMAGGVKSTDTHKEINLNITSRDTQGGGLTYGYNGSLSRFENERNT